MKTFLHCYRHFRLCGMTRIEAIRRAGHVASEGF